MTELNCELCSKEIKLGKLYWVHIKTDFIEYKKFGRFRSPVCPECYKNNQKKFDIGAGQ